VGGLGIYAQVLKTRAGGGCGPCGYPRVRVGSDLAPPVPSPIPSARAQSLSLFEFICLARQVPDSERRNCVFLALDPQPCYSQVTYQRRPSYLASMVILTSRRLGSECFGNYIFLVLTMHSLGLLKMHYADGTRHIRSRNYSNHISHHTSS